MLCRGLLAAIALTCTLPRVYANDQGTPRALKDLVCVLFLSGIQKEDLEVGLLKKMKHYNINYDKNNEDLRKECMNNTEIKAVIDNKTTEKETTITTTTSTTTTSTTTSPTTIALATTPPPILDTNELESVLKYLKHKKKMRNPTTTDHTTSTTESTEKPRQLLETLMSELEKRFRQPQEKQENITKEPGLEDLNKYLLPFTKKLDQLISQTSIKTENRTSTSVEQTPQNEDDATKESVKNNDVFKNIKQISKDLDILLSKKSTVPPKTTVVELNTVKTEYKTAKPQYLEDIEQKFILGIAAINKLNENIVNLQKNFNEPTLEQANQTEDMINKFPNREGSNNQQSDNARYVQNMAAADKYINNPIAKEKSELNVPLQSYHIQNSQLGFAPKVSNYWEPTQYDSRFADSLSLAKNNPNQSIYKTKDMIPARNSDNIKTDEKMDYNLQIFKENINYDNEKETSSGNTNISQNLKVDPPMVYVPQIVYSTKQLSNNIIRNIHYNTDASTFQDGNQDMLPYNINSETLPIEPYVPTVKKNANIYSNNQIQNPDAKQLIQDPVQSNIEIKTSQDTNSIQNGLPEGYYDDNQKRIESQMLKLKEHLFNVAMNKEYGNREPAKDPPNAFEMEMVNRLAEAVKDMVLKDLNKTLTPNSLSTSILLTTTAPTPLVTTSTTSAPFTITATTSGATVIATTTFSSSTLTTSRSTMTTRPSCTSKSAFSVATNGDQTNSNKTDNKKEQAAILTIAKLIQQFEKMNAALFPIKNSEKVPKFTQIPILPKRNAPLIMYSPSTISRIPKQSPIIIHNYVAPGPMPGRVFPPKYGPRLDSKFNSMSTKYSMSPKYLTSTKHSNYIQPRFPGAIIQTNTQEIKPLGVPLLKPESINMNIIVTTRKPWRDTRNQMNYVYRQLDKKTQYSFNVYSNNNVDVKPIENKGLYKDTAQRLTNSNLPADDYTKMKMYQQVNAEKITNNENKNGIRLGKLIHPSIIQNNGVVNQMPKNYPPMLGFPDIIPISNRYNIPTITPNLLFDKLQQRGSFPNQMRNNVMSQDSNVFRQNIKLPDDIQYGNYKENNFAGRNNPDPVTKPPLKPTISDQLNNIIEICKNLYANPNFAGQVQNAEALKNYCNQLNLHPSGEHDPFKAMPSYRVKYSDTFQPSFEHTLQNRPEYHPEVALSDYFDSRDSFRNLEKYIDPPQIAVDRKEAMIMRQKALLKQARDYSRPKYQTSQIEKDLTQSSSSNKVNNKYESSGKLYSSASEVDSNRESQRTHADLMHAELNFRNDQKGNPERLHTDNSDLYSSDTKGRLLESTESEKHASKGRGGYRGKAESRHEVEQSATIQERQQKPLTKHKYDSERFKKFLNTQKKVNRMLEMILGAKADPADDPTHKPDLFDDVAHSDEFNIVAK